MILGNTDIELLKLAAWCKNMPSDISGRFQTRVFHPQILQQMVGLELITVTGNNSCIRLRPKGSRFLRNIGFDYHEDAQYRCHYERRLDISNILLTFYRAGYNVFAESADDLETSQVFLQSAVARRGSSAGDLWGGASFYGMACIRDFVTACYYITGHEDARLYYRNEKLMLDKAASKLRRKESQIFAGSDYLGIAKILRNRIPKDGSVKDGKRTYTEIYKDVSCPLYLLECSDAGARQLLIMSQEQYRKRLIMAIAQMETAPPVGVRDADGEVKMPGDQYPAPIMLAVDMDVKRIDRAYRQTMDAGFPKLYLVCLEEQQKALEYLYAKTGRAKVFKLSEKIIVGAFGGLKLYEPKLAVYFDREGGVLDATNLPTDRKDGEQIRSED